MSHPGLIVEFIVFSIIIWVAGVWLTHATDAIDAKYRLGSAFGGLLILGITTSLPEIAISVSAAVQHHYGIIIGTLLGGIAIQTVIISLLDARMEEPMPLTFSAASLTLVLEAATVVLVTVASIIAIKTPLVLPHTSISLASLLIFLLWLVGLWLVYQARRGLPWKSEAIAAKPGRAHHQRRVVINHPALKNSTTLQIFIVLILAAVATLVAGIGVQNIGSQLASAYHIGSGLFAATFIALTGALSNLSTGLKSIDLKDYQLAMSDIFGGNACMPPLFLVCDIVAGHAVLTHATSSDVWFAAVGVLLTSIYIISLIVRPRKLFARMGVDSILVLVLYVLGIIALAKAG